MTIRVVPDCPQRSRCVSRAQSSVVSSLHGAALEPSPFPVRGLQKLGFPGHRLWRNGSVVLLCENTRGCLALSVPPVLCCKTVLVGVTLFAVQPGV